MKADGTGYEKKYEDKNSYRGEVRVVMAIIPMEMSFPLGPEQEPKGMT